MPSGREFIYWDSCVFLSYINDDPNRAADIQGVLLEVERDDDLKIVTATVSKVEVAYGIRQQQWVVDIAIEDAIDALWSDPNIEFVEFSEAIALKARELMRYAIRQGWSLKPMDAIHLASAKWLKGQAPVRAVHTYDLGKLSRFSEIVGCEIVHPHSIQPPLLDL